MKIMTATNVSYCGEMYQVITRTFFTFFLSSTITIFRSSPSLKCVLQPFSVVFYTIFFGRGRRLIDSTCLFAVKVSIYQNFSFPGYSIFVNCTTCPGDGSKHIA